MRTLLIVLSFFCFACADSTSTAVDSQRTIPLDLSQVRICPQCGIVNDLGNKFCRDCGRSFSGQQMNSAPQTIQIVTRPQKSVADAVILSILLPGCGHFLNGNNGKGVGFLMGTAMPVILGTSVAVGTDDANLGAGIGMAMFLGSGVVHLADVITAGIDAHKCNTEPKRSEQENSAFGLYT